MKTYENIQNRVEFCKITADGKQLFGMKLWFILN